ncbi:hypothetical protein LPJ61_006549 [Coemansia biformis]|uniref:Uncharacterized protein n=1 Tax=Coemansia biformis TaxID=1286918 RepID=A0A9W7XUC6_9FUNG|nr:hypothetical protein LPJ61_006549 [Coemansia biformis]
MAVSIKLHLDICRYNELAEPGQPQEFTTYAFNTMSELFNYIAETFGVTEDEKLLFCNFEYAIVPADMDHTKFDNLKRFALANS